LVTVVLSSLMSSLVAKTLDNLIMSFGVSIGK
jgi:hypothetical protein